MSRGIRKLILGGMKGAVLNQREAEERAERERERADREAERAERIRERVAILAASNPEAFEGMTTAPEVKLPEIVAPRTVAMDAPAPPLPRVGEKAAPRATVAQPNVTSEQAAPEWAAGVRKEIAPLKKAPIETMGVAEAQGRVAAHDQQKKIARDVRNKAAFQGLKLEGEYDPEMDYTKEFAKQQTEQREKKALYDHYIAQGLPEDEAADLAETGGKVLSVRRQKENESRAETREERAAVAAERAAAAAERAERREGRIEGQAARSEQTRARDRIEKQRRASIEGNASRWARMKDATPEKVAAAIVKWWPDFSPGEAHAIAAKAIRAEKGGKSSSSATSDLDEFGEGDDETPAAVAPRTVTRQVKPQAAPTRTRKATAAELDAALDAAGGDVAKAAEALRKKGLTA